MSHENPLPSDIFNALVGDVMANQPKEINEFSSHPDDDQGVQGMIEIISKAGGVEKLQPRQMTGIVIEVVDYFLDEETQRMLNTSVQHEQMVTWITSNGLKMRFGWDEQKQFRSDIDYRDFPDGFKKDDLIRVTGEKGFINKIERISAGEIWEMIHAKKSHNTIG